MSLEEETISKIKTLLKLHPKGLTISEISSRLKMNRNSAAKYLEVLLISGQVESRSYGTAKVFFLTHRIPISAMLSISADIVLILDERHTIVFCNDKFLEFFGLSREAVMGHHVVDIYRPGTSDTLLVGMISDILVDPDVIREIPLTRPDRQYYFRIKGIGTVFDDGTKGTTIILEDMTREKMYQIDLEEKEARYRAIVEDQAEFITRFNPDGILTFVNASYARYYDRQPVDLIGQPYFPGLCNEDRETVLQALGSISRENPVTTFECQVASPEGRLHWHIWTVRAFFNGGEKPFEYQGVGRDNTEKRETAAKINRHVADMEFICERALDFIELPIDGNIYDTIAAGLESILPCAIVTCVSRFDSDIGLQTISSVRIRNGGADISPICKQFIGRPVHGDNKYGALMASGRLFRIPLMDFDENLRTEIHEVLSEAVANAGTMEIYSIGFTRSGQNLGSATFFLADKPGYINISLVETYTRQASIALQKRIVEDSLMQSEELFSNIAEYSPLSLSISDPSGKYRYVNRRFSETFGYDLTDFHTGKEWFRLAFPDPEYRKDTIKTWKEDLAQFRVGELRPRTFTVTCKNGLKKDIFFRAVTLSDGKQCVVYEDITDRRRADHNSQFLSAIIESTSDAVIGKDTGGRVISWNRSAERIYGYTKDEMIGRNIRAITVHTRLKETEEIMQKVSRGESVIDLETIRTRKDGAEINVALTISPIMDETGKVVGASTIARDISRHHAEDRLIREEKKAGPLVENTNCRSVP